MANKKTIALTTEQYNEIIDTMKTGFTGFRSNNRIATALVLEANLGLRISDILKLTLNDIIKDGNRYRLDITEQKTGKKRMFTVPTEIYQYIKIYCLENGIQPHEQIFPITERAVQKQLKIVCDYLGYCYSFTRVYKVSISIKTCKMTINSTCYFISFCSVFRQCDCKYRIINCHRSSFCVEIKCVSVF